MTEPTKPKRKYTRKPPGFDHQSKEALLDRQHKRRANELALAKEYGFNNVYSMLTAMLKREKVLIDNPEKVTNAEIT